MLFSGCEDYLEQLPDQRTQLNTPEKVSELLVTAYPAGNYITFSEAMSDNVTDNLGNSNVYPVNTNPYFWEDVEDINQDSPTYYWNTCYAAIAAANQALEACKNAANPQEYKAQRGEALLARAYAHFMLVTFFSKYNPATATSDPGIPYVTEPETVVIKKYDRKTVAYVYEQIEKDILEGLPLINDNVYTVPAYHFTKKAAHAFATRFYLFKNDPEKVVYHANQAFPSNNFAGNMRPWTTTYQGLPSAELGPTYGRATESSNLLLGETVSWWGRRYRSYRFNMTSPLLNKIKAPLGINLAYKTYYSGNSYYILKHVEHFVRTSINATTGRGYNMVPLLTTEEVLLNRAEAYVMQEQYELALADMNTFLSTRVLNYNPGTHNLSENKIKDYYKAQTSETKQAFINAVLDLKRAEFVQEGLRWLDIKRHRLPVQHELADKQLITLTPDDPRRELQIPQDALKAGLELNPR